MRSLASTLALSLALAIAVQDPSAPRAADELYPAELRADVVRFVQVKTDEPDLAAMTAALQELGARVVYGPRTTDGRPGRAFFALQAPRGVKPKELERAAGKSGGVASALAVVAFEGRDDRDLKIDVGGMSFTSRDFVLGMSGEIAWFDSVGGWSQFYGAPGKLTALELADRYEKLVQPYGGGTLGNLVRERFTWKLKSAPDAKVAAKLLKDVRKLSGVADAGLEGDALTLSVALEDLAACGVSGSVPAAADGKAELDAAGLGAPRASFDTGPLWELLEASDLAPSGR
jgi:hypothetical protein